jgi:hypothetical protein
MGAAGEAPAGAPRAAPTGATASWERGRGIWRWVTGECVVGCFFLLLFIAAGFDLEIFPPDAPPYRMAGCRLLIYNRF